MFRCLNFLKMSQSKVFFTQNEDVIHEVMRNKDTICEVTRMMNKTSQGNVQIRKSKSRSFKK